MKMKHHEKLRQRANNHGRLAWLFAALTAILGAATFTALSFGLLSVLPFFLPSTLLFAVFAVWQYAKYWDSSRSADLAEVFDWEDRNR